jgi:hypothetical protein
MEGTSSQYTLPATAFDWLDGGNGYSPLKTTYNIYEIPGGFLFGDIDGDGMTDLIKYFALENPGQSYVTVYVIPYLSRGDGTFMQRQLLQVAAQCYPDEVSVSVGDVNNDGWADIVSNGRYDCIHTYLSNGNGTFSGPFSAAGPNTDAVFLAEINGDGYVDLIRHSEYNGTVYSYLSKGDGTFQESGAHTGPGGVGGGSIRLADVNGDGLSDLIKLETGPIHI